MSHSPYHYPDYSVDDVRMRRKWLLEEMGLDVVGLVFTDPNRWVRTLAWVLSPLLVLIVPLMLAVWFAGRFAEFSLALVYGLGASIFITAWNVSTLGWVPCAVATAALLLWSVVLGLAW